MLQQIQDGIDMATISRALQLRTQGTIQEHGEVSQAWNRLVQRLSPPAPPAPPQDGAK